MDNLLDFVKFPKMARLSRECVISEKLNGSNGHIYITEKTPETQPNPFIIGEFDDTVGTKFVVFAGSRNRYITPGKSSDNYGFASWVKDNLNDLKELGPGRHYGEFWGSGIQSGYGLKEKRFSLFNTIRWCLHDAEPQIISNNNPNSPPKYQEKLPKCVGLVPVLYKGLFDTNEIDKCLNILKNEGSKAAPGFNKPEGVVVYHVAAGICFKKLIENDELPKSLVK